MKRAKNGRVTKIAYGQKFATSAGVGPSGGLQLRALYIITPSTKARLDRLACWGYGSRPNERVNGIIYRSPWAFIRAVMRTRRILRGKG